MAKPKLKQTKQADAPKLQVKQAANSAQSKIRWPLIILCLVSLGAVGSSLYFYNQSRRTEQLLKEKTSNQLPDDSVVIEDVGRHILLPEGEEPTIATVTDKSKLANQPFFDQAETGDKVIVYPVKRRVILYRPSLDKIVEMSVLANNDESTSTNTSTPVVPAPENP